MLEKFINKGQLRFLESLISSSEESEHFKSVKTDLIRLIKSMPKTGDQSEASDPICYLHYFHPNGDWWIIEKDMEAEQLQAFCFACLNGWKDCAELGYVSIEDILANNAELDFHFEPRPLSQVKTEGGFQ